MTKCEEHTWKPLPSSILNEYKTLNLAETNGNPEKALNIMSFKKAYEFLLDNDGSSLTFPFGKDLDGNIIAGDLKIIPNMLVLGTSDSGDSMFLSSLIVALIMRNSPNDLKVALFDNKKKAFQYFENTPHLLYPVVGSNDEGIKRAQDLFDELDKRYSLLKKHHLNNIEEYNEMSSSSGLKKLHHILVVVNDISEFIKSSPRITLMSILGVLALTGKRAGIHIIIGTRGFPKNTDVYLKGHFSTKLSFKSNEENKLDMLVNSKEMFAGETKCIHGCYIHRKEIERVINKLIEISK